MELITIGILPHACVNHLLQHAPRPQAVAVPTPTGIIQAVRVERIQLVRLLQAVVGLITIGILPHACVNHLLQHAPRPQAVAVPTPTGIIQAVRV